MREHGRTCSHCGEWKPAADFYKATRKNSVLGLSSRCRGCISELNATERLTQHPSLEASPLTRPGFGHAGNHLVGIIGEAHFIEFAASSGWQIFRGLAGHEPYDYVVDTGMELLRVEVKCTRTVRGRSARSKGKSDWVTSTKLNTDANRYDFLFVSTPKGWYWIPAAECPRWSFSTTIQNATNGDKWEQYRVA